MGKKDEKEPEKLKTYDTFAFWSMLDSRILVNFLAVANLFRPLTAWSSKGTVFFFPEKFVLATFLVKIE